jgi:phosphoglycerate dehydrogenase-like enzyme
MFPEVGDRFMTTRLNIVIATPLEPGLVEQIHDECTDSEIRYEPDLLPPVRYTADHRGANFHRTPDQQVEWDQLLLGAEVTFGIPGDDPRQLSELVRGAPALRLVQATAAGAGQQVEAAGLSTDELERTAIASTSGVHAGPLAEFALAGILYFARGIPRLKQDQAARTWDHYPTRDVAGRTVVIVGIGAIGSRVAHYTKTLGMHVIAVNSTGHRPDVPVDEYAASDQLPDLMPRADVLVITLPATRLTAGMITAAMLSALPADSIVVNVGRGEVIDEQALVERLTAGSIAGAALDVTNHEPPDTASYLWTLPNVLLSPHTAALSPCENQRIVALFIDNVHRLRNGEPILNRITAAHPY